MEDEQNTEAEPKKPKETSFEHLGGRKVGGHHVPVKSEKEIRFESVGGRRVHRSPLWQGEESVHELLAALEARVEALEDRLRDAEQ
jgi:hypothetical protein